MDTPLVSINIITYNSAKYVKETFLSAVNQTYPNIEIIVSDDCSTDNTQQIIKDLINSHPNVPAKLVSTPQNSGISANCNNALKYDKGEWIKGIAGDDILQPDCITTFMQAAMQGKDKFFICGILPFTDEGKELPSRMLPKDWFQGDARSQEKLLVKKGTIIEGPALFLNRSALVSLGGYNEMFPLAEDYAFYMTALANGYRFQLVDAYLVRYREHEGSASRGNILFSESIFSAIEYYAIPASKRNHMYHYTWHLLINKWIRRKVIKRRIFGYLLRATDVLAWKELISRKK